MFKCHVRFCSAPATKKAIFGIQLKRDAIGTPIGGVEEVSQLLCDDCFKVCYKLFPSLVKIENINQKNENQGCNRAP